MNIGDKGTIVRNGVVYYVKIVEIGEYEIRVESYRGLYFMAWISKSDWK